MVIFSKINFLVSCNLKATSVFSRLVDKQDIKFASSLKKKTSYVLNKSPHVHKKAKERFVFFWPRKMFYISPAFLDFSSYYSFLSAFVKRFYVMHQSGQVFFKTNVFLK